MFFVAPARAATINARSAALADVSAAIVLAKSGDTVVVPAGTASWTSALLITKGITLVGATTVTNAGTHSPTVKDLTIIKDDSPLNTKESGLIHAEPDPSQSFRLTGFTFTHGSRTTSNNVGVVHLESGSSSSPHFNMRVDNCHFDQIYGRNIQTDGWVYGLADHNYIVAHENSQSFYINCASYAGYTSGHGAWADFPWFGTNKFFFIEDNTIVGNGLVTTSGGMDAEYGARWVARHNDLTNAHIGWHGTEGNNRGCRAVEMYNNSFHWTIIPAQKNRSGVSLQHDNTWDVVAKTDPSHSQISIYRVSGGVTTDSAYGVASGANVWDLNDTEGNGTYVQGHPPHLFDSGKATTASTKNANQATLTDTSKNWPPNKWVGYSVMQTDPSAASYKKASYIISNTATTITYFLYTSGDRGPLFVFNTGNTYAIHRVLTAMDQAGRGKGDLLRGNNPAVNTVTGVAGWPRQALEPAFSWNNVATRTNTAWGFTSDVPTEVEGRDYYNLGAAFAPNTTPSKVSSTYPASLNGVAYTGTYTYPHPLTGPAPPTNLTVVAGQ
jgi:hypothetical protein